LLTSRLEVFALEAFRLLMGSVSFVGLGPCWEVCGARTH
jgi:hypothetical protein